MDQVKASNRKNDDDRSDTLLRAQARCDYEDGRVAEGMRDVYYKEIERLCEAENE